MQIIKRKKCQIFSSDTCITLKSNDENKSEWHFKKIALTKYIFILFLAALSSTLISQVKDTTAYPNLYSVDLEKNLSILTGYNVWKYHFAEIGLAINQYGRIGLHPSAWAYFLSNEIKIDKKILIGPKIGVWIGGGAAGMALGLNLICYTNFNSSSLCLRPEVGLGFNGWKVVYGYNIMSTNRDFYGINKNNLSIAFMFKLKNIKSIQR